MDLTQEHELPGDLSALAWVQDELRRTLDNAHKSLRRHVRNLEIQPAEERAAGPAPALMQARNLMHQGAGALDMIGMQVPGRVLHGAEQVVQRMVSGDLACNEEAVASLEHASFAVLDFLGRQLAGKQPVSLGLFPQFKTVMALAGVDRIHPADMWEGVPQAIAIAGPSVPNAKPDPRIRQAIETRLLKYMRSGDSASAHRMAEQFGRLAQIHQGRLGELWNLAATFFEIQSTGLLDADLYAKRLASRLLVQLRAVERGQTDCPERLLQDLLFFCARSKRDDAKVPRLGEVITRYRLPSLDRIDYESSSLGRYDPAQVPLARRRVATLKETWSAAAAGELTTLVPISEQAALVSDSIRNIYPEGERLARALQSATDSAVRQGQVPAPALAMEVATTLLCLDASLDEVDPDHPELKGRIQQIADRLETVTNGNEAPPLEPWIEALYRSVSDRQSMGSVVQELRASLAEIEQHLDQFNRNPEDKSALSPVPAQFHAMRGVLSVLGLDQAAQAALRMRDDVHAVLDGTAEAERATVELADNLGALSFLIDMLGVQPQLAKSLFQFDASTGRFSARMGRAQGGAAAAPSEPSLLDQVQNVARTVAQESISTEDLSRHLEGLADQAVVADEPSVAQVLTEARKVLDAAQDTESQDAARADVAQTLSSLATPALAPEVVQAPVATPASVQVSPTPVSGANEDDEMREIFLEEAREVLQQAGDALTALREDGQDLEAMTSVRRSFHTLKGSSRMVGLKDFGEAAWACEQLYNTRLAEAQVDADAALCTFTERAFVDLGEWIERISQGQESSEKGAPLIAEAQRLRSGAAPEPAPLPLQSASALIAEQALEADELIEMPEVVEPDGAGEVASWDTATLPLPTLGESVTHEEVGESDDVLHLDLSALEAEAEAEKAPEQPVVADLLDPTDLALPDLDLSESPNPAMALEPSGDAASTTQEAGVVASIGTLAPMLVAEEDAADTAEADGWSSTSMMVPEEMRTPEVDLVLDFDLDLSSFPSLPDQQAASETAEAITEGPVDEAKTTETPVEEVAGDESVPAPMVTEGEDDGLDLVLDDIAAQVPDTPAVELIEPEAEKVPELEGTADDAERYKIVGPLRIQIALFNIYLNEADEQSRRLCVELSEWKLELFRPVGENAIALAHSLAGNSATVGFADLSALARRLEHSLERSEARGRGEAEEASLYLEVAEEIRRLLHQFAAGFLKPIAPEILERLARHEANEQALHDRMERLNEAEREQEDAPATGFAALSPLGEMRFSPLEAVEKVPAQPTQTVQPSTSSPVVLGEQIDAADVIDAELFEIFVEEGAELLPQMAEHLREWEARPDQLAPGVAAMRALHTFKGGARLAGAMRLGELAHRLETAIERQTSRGAIDLSMLGQLYQGVDALAEEFQRLKSGGGREVASVSALPTEPAVAARSAEAQPEAAGLPDVPLGLAEALVADAGQSSDIAAAVNDVPAPVDASVPNAAARVDWAKIAKADVDAQSAAGATTFAEFASMGSVRVRAPLLDRMVSHAGEVGIARARMESDVQAMQGSLRELTDNLERLRRQLRDLELQAETQMATRIEAARSSRQEFDPLEMDRFTRVQELTRMMAESVSDVGTVQRSLTQTLQDAEDQLAMQARLARDLQDDLLRARMMEFDTLSDRLYRVVRQAAKETGKQVRLNLSGGGIEMDRAVLDRIAPPLEHLLRNAVVHGIERPALREVTGKEATGNIEITLRQTGNEVQLDVRDDGAGLNLVRISERAREAGLLPADARATEAELAALIFAPGFTTAEEVSELAGRGIGMDVVRSEVNAMGGRVEISSSTGKGTAFRMVLPLTTAVTQVVLLQAGKQSVAVPSTLVETVRRIPAEELKQAYKEGVLKHGEDALPFYWLGSLLQDSLIGAPEGRTNPVVVIRSADQRVAVHVSQILGNQEVVVKNLGPQLSRLPGLTGMSVRANGDTVLIYNPVALVAVYGGDVRQRLMSLPEAGSEVVPVVEAVPEPTVQKAPLVLVVDDSLTVRRVTQRLLQREGYRVGLAKDGLEALERLADERPAVMLCDIEMPRMDGFDLVNNLRNDNRLRDLPVVMITSRIAEKHQEHARELGVNHYLGKPYDEDVLLTLVRQYAGVPVTA